MGRPRKIPEKSDNLLTEEEIWDVVRFAKLVGGDEFLGISPMLVSQRMKDVTLNPMSPTESTLTSAMQSPKDSEKALQAFSQDFEIQSQVYKKLISYLADMLSFDMTYICTNVKKEEEYKSKKYQDDLDKVKMFFDKFDYQKEFRTIVRQLIRNEAYFGCTRFGSEQLVFQELPSSPDYTMINGRWDYGLSFSFNMLWFLQPGVDLRMYPPFFKEKYAKFIKSKPMGGYVPSLPSEMRGNSSYIYWQDIPSTVGWCFKFNPEIATRIPYFSGLFLDLIQQPLMRALQKNVNMSVASRLIMGQVGTLKDAGAKTKDQFNISPDVLGKFLALVKAAIGESIKVAAAPLDNLQSVNFTSENELYSSFLKTALASSGINTNLIFTSDTRPNSVETQLSLNNDEQLMTNLYPQFNSFLNYWVNKATEKYKFKFFFEGTSFYNNREIRFERQMSLADKGIVMPQKIAAAIGMNPFDMQRQMQEARAMDFVDKLTPIVSGFQMSGGDAAGRPKKKDNELTDSGEATRSSASNIEKGGKTT